jgi:hypothetical protein
METPYNEAREYQGGCKEPSDRYANYNNSTISKLDLESNIDATEIIKESFLDLTPTKFDFDAKLHKLTEEYSV